MKILINKNQYLTLLEEIKKSSVICDKCGWSWKLSEGGEDKYLCHKCGKDNTPKN